MATALSNTEEEKTEVSIGMPPDLFHISLFNTPHYPLTRSTTQSITRRPHSIMRTSGKDAGHSWVSTDVIRPVVRFFRNFNTIMLFKTANYRNICHNYPLPGVKPYAMHYVSGIVNLSDIKESTEALDNHYYQNTSV